MTEEATERAHKYFNELFTRCGDSVFTNEWSNILKSNHVLQFKNGGLTFDSGRQITNAERLNGIAWKGEFRLFAAAQRTRNATGTWEPWEDFDPRLTRWYFEVVKTTSGWQVDPSQYSSWKKFSKVSCYSSNGKVVIRDPNDLSDTYGYLKPYIFNKKTLVIFTTPDQFFADSGKRSFTGLKYDSVTKLPPGLHFANGRRLTLEDYRKIENGQ